jgi:hypothetical protein
MIEFILDGKFGVHHFAAFGARQQCGQAVIILRADDDIDDRCAADDLLALGLRHAAGHRNGETAVGAGCTLLELSDAAELGIHLLRRLLADVTGVEHDQVGLLRRGRLDKTQRRQRIRHTLRIVDVHLAAVGFDVKLPKATRCCHAARRR